MVYDLGLSMESANNIKGKCLVELRRFPFEEYPSYVGNLKEYRWKSLVMAMALKEFGAIWYMDSSVRWLEDSRQMVYKEVMCRLYSYLPTDIEALKTERCYDAAFAFIAKTVEASELMRWYVLCALEKDCMGPPEAQLACSFAKDKLRIYANCHRYDQSVINILLANAYDYKANNYVVRIIRNGRESVVLHRYPENNLTASNFSCSSELHVH
ncbi:unnamed protein product [Strongylus vulgaris]|uniref:Uncharacterized protein n=1 Tax=Strongylus vulgaris TaxID=40348 RepID=A0A3P7IL54_STRVU|nr:unnamed protein product [Strongylus vulgaris]